jgi:hypothetical protein
MPAAPTTGQVILDGTPLLVVPGTYSKGEDPLYGRAPLRLDSPINLSPVSTFRQSSYIGGMGQEKWSDEEMYYLGDADTRFGYIQCKYEMVQGPGSGGDDRRKVTAIRPYAPGQLPRIYFAGYQTSTLKRWNFNTGAFTNAWVAPGGGLITALGRSFYGGQYGLHIGMNNGELFAISSGSETVGSKPRIDTAGPVTFLSSLGSRGDIAGTGQGDLWKTTNGTWTKFGKVDMPVYDGEQWNQRLWIVGNDEADRSALYVTDTVTTQEVYRWQSSFEARAIQLHNGQLYIMGQMYNDPSTSGGDDTYTGRIGQIWAYNGSSMRLIFQVPDEIWEPSGFSYHGIYDATSHFKWLAFTMPHKGLWFYDPEQDAIHPGPVHESPQVDNFDLPVTALDFGGRLISFLYNGVRPRYQPKPVTFKNSYLQSSEYDAGLPGQKKSWLRARVRLKEPLPSGASVQLLYTTQHVEIDGDSGPHWTSLGTATGSALSHVLSFPGPTNQPISEVIRLLVKLTAGTSGASTPKVAAIELDYLVVPDVKWSWSFQAVGAEGLVRPDDAAYQYPDSQSVQSALETARRNSAKKWVTFVDEDGVSYSVQIVSLTTYRPNLDSSNEDGEHAIFALTVAEV